MESLKVLSVRWSAYERPGQHNDWTALPPQLYYSFLSHVLELIQMSRFFRCRLWMQV